MENTLIANVSANTANFERDKHYNSPTRRDEISREVEEPPLSRPVLTKAPPNLARLGILIIGQEFSRHQTRQNRREPCHLIGHQIFVHYRHDDEQYGAGTLFHNSFEAQKRQRIGTIRTFPPFASKWDLQSGAIRLIFYHI